MPDDLRQNLLTNDQGTVLLDAGPLLESSDALAKIRGFLATKELEIAHLERRDKMLQFLSKFPDNEFRGQKLEMMRRLEASKQKVTPEDVAEAERQSRLAVTSNAPPNSLMLIMHGSEDEPGFYPDAYATNLQDRAYQLAEIAAAIGPATNDIRNFQNLACYGGHCQPEEVAKYFPNVTNINQMNPETSNRLGLRGMEAGQYFDPASAVENYYRDPAATNWTKRLP